MARGSVLFVVLLGLFSCLVAAQAPPSGKRTLVLIQSNDIKATHSAFFRSLEARGHKLTFALADNDSTKLQKYGDYLYDQLILFAPSIDTLGGGVDVKAILKFIDDGHDVLIAADSKVSGPVRDLAAELGVDFAEDGSSVIDHLHFDSSDFNGDHTLILSDNYVEEPSILTKPKTPVLFRGIGATLVESNRLVFPLLSGYSSSYTARPNQLLTSRPDAVGKRTVLVAALQARNNARVIISGSLELFSNRFFDSLIDSNGKRSASGNSAFVSEITQWAFKDKAVLKVTSFTHKKTDGTTGVYRIRDEVEFSAVIQEWKNGAWVPFKSNEVQLEFVRVDPFVRATLKHDDNGKFFTTFKAPEQYGVFTFKLVHRRLGYTFVTDSFETVKVRPFRHNEYERFIPAAYPYYAAVFSMLFGFSIFSFFFLYHREPAPSTK